MDLKEVVANSKVNSAEALSAFNAGHHDKAEKYLMAQMLETAKYFDEQGISAGDVTELPTSEKKAEPSMEKREEVPGAALPATQFVASDAAQQIGQGPAEPKPAQ